MREREQEIESGRGRERERESGKDMTSTSASASWKGGDGDVVVSKEVADALAAREPVVALESTILCHGMPYPSNVATAVEVEQIIRASGAGKSLPSQTKKRDTYHELRLSKPKTLAFSQPY